MKSSAADYATAWQTISGLPADTVVPSGTRIISNKLLAGDAQPAFRLFGSGKIEIGPGGSTAPDTNLYRKSSAAWLVTDVGLDVTKDLYVQAYSAQWNGIGVPSA